MIDLTDVSGMPIKFDDEKGRFYFAEDLAYEGEYTVALSEIIPILLNRSLKYPEVVYKYSRNIYSKAVGSFSSNISFDLLYVPFGLLGIEYIKTHVYYNSACDENKMDCIIEVLYGELTVVMQKNCNKESDFEYDTKVDELIVVTLHKGNRLAIPTGVFYTFINTGGGPLILSKVSSPNWKPIDYSILRKEKGLACYIISKNAKVETVANPKYKIEGKVRAIPYKKFLQSVLTTNSVYNELANSGIPLIKLVNKFVELF